MIYKLASLVSMCAAAVFAGLYFTEIQNQPLPVTLENEIHAAGPGAAEIELPEVNSQHRPLSEGKTIEKPSVIIKEIDVFKGVSPEDVTIMMTMREQLRKDYTRNLKKDHPILFDKLRLDAVTEEEFIGVLGDRLIIKRLRPDNDLSDEAKEAFDLQKEQMLATVDQKIAGVLGSQFETYTGYRQKSEQYQEIAELDRKLETQNSVLNENQQDKLADILFSVKETVTDFDWRTMRDHPDKMDEWLSIYKESQLVVKNQANEFLDEVQYKEFEKRLQSKFKRYEGWISKQKKKNKSK